MNLHEFQAKSLLAKHQIPVPAGEVAASGAMARAIASRLGGPVVVKAQVLTGGRGKAGGVVLAPTPVDASREAARLIGSTIKGLPVTRVLVERAAEIVQELYVGLVMDRSAGCMMLMVSGEGGVDIEETARANPDAIHRIPINPLLGLRSYHATRAASSLGLALPYWKEFYAICARLYQTAEEMDATLAEINPLVITADETLLAVDAKMVVDDNALFRHLGLQKLHDLEGDPTEREARDAGISYIKLDGRIGCMVNGAGLAMATMDVIQLCGGAPANFLDVGGGAKAERVATALRLILSDKQVASVLVNVFGGITRCDEVARGILEALEVVKTEVPLVVRLVGTNEKEGRALLEQAHFTVAQSLTEGAQKAVAAAGGA